MEWLFEPMIEAAAWFAFVMGAIFCGGAVWTLILWALSRGEQTELLSRSGHASAGFILSAIALGTLACIDRYVFELPDEPQA